MKTVTRKAHVVNDLRSYVVPVLLSRLTLVRLIGENFYEVYMAYEAKTNRKQDKKLLSICFFYSCRC